MYTSYIIGAIGTSPSWRRFDAPNSPNSEERQSAISIIGFLTERKQSSSKNFYCGFFTPLKRMDTRRDTFISWLKPNCNRIKFARKGYLSLLFDEYNNDHPEARLKSKGEMSRWLYYFRRSNDILIHYCPTKRQKIRSRAKHSNYEEE